MLQLSTTSMRHASLACHMLTTRPHVRAFVKSLAAPRAGSIADCHNQPTPTRRTLLHPLQPLPTAPPVEALLQTMGCAAVRSASQRRLHTQHSTASTLAALAPRCTAIAIDPDTSGAIAIVRLEQDGGSWRVHTTLHDIPVVHVPIGKRIRRYEWDDSVKLTHVAKLTNSPLLHIHATPPSNDNKPGCVASARTHKQAAIDH